jgi:hypothetical protein
LITLNTMALVHPKEQRGNQGQLPQYYRILAGSFGQCSRRGTQA